MTDVYSVDDTTRRNHWGQYLIVPPSGGKPVGYVRATTVAKEFDSGGGLADWKAAMTVCGLIPHRGLRARWETLMASSGGNPWYASEQTKRACKELVEECAAVGGANDRRDVGSALHAMTALRDSGQVLPALSSETSADLEAYAGGLTAAGVSVVPGAIEMTVVLDDWQVAGTFDRVVAVRHRGVDMIADLKCGLDLSYSWQSFAIQLAIYSRADAVYRQGAAEDGSEDQRLEMPKVSRKRGLIMWLPAGAGKLELHVVDLQAGWTAFERAMWVRGWRRQKVSTPFEPAEEDWNLTLLKDRIAKLTLEQKLECSLQLRESGIPTNPAKMTAQNIEIALGLVGVYLMGESTAPLAR